MEAFLTTCQDGADEGLPTIEELEQVHQIPEKPGPAPNKPEEPRPGTDVDTDDLEGWQPSEEETAEFEIAVAKYTEDKAEWDQEKASYDRKVSIQKWYLDSYLPTVVGVEWWGLQIRPYKLMTDTTEVKGQGEKVLVTVASEAFGLVLYENCRDRWLAAYKYNKEHGTTRRCPVYHPKKKETYPFKGKWSDAKQGQQSSWDSAAIKRFNEHKAKIKAFRAQDKENNNAVQEYFRDLLQEDLDQDGDEPAQKKAKVGENGVPVPAYSQEVVLDFDDE